MKSLMLVSDAMSLMTSPSVVFTGVVILAFVADRAPWTI